MSFIHRKHVVIALGCLAMFLKAGAALSASSASAIVDWNTFLITSVDLGNGEPSFDLFEETTIVRADAGSGILEDTVADWENRIVSYIERDWTTAHAQADSDILSSEADNTNAVDRIYAEVERAGVYQIIGSGLLIFEVDYLLLASVGDAAETARAEVGFWADIENINGGTKYYSSSHNIFLNASNDELSPLSPADTLSLALVVLDGDLISFRSFASVAVTSVPLPPSLWLMGSALVVLLRQRKNELFRVAAG